MIEEFKKGVEHVIDTCKNDMAAMRASQASPALVENIVVEAYESKTPLQQLASISCPDTRTIVIQPWDKSVLKNIEQAVQASSLGINPVNEGDVIRVNMPPLTEERRLELVKKVKEKVEEFRIRIRQERDKARENVQKAEKANDITEDDRFNMFDQIDSMTTDYNKQLKELAEKKEKEIMTI